MKIYITGPVGGGKSTLARALAHELGLQCTELDSVVHRLDPNSPNGNRKRSEAERDALFLAALAGDRWVMEDTGRKCFAEAMRQADMIILLEPPALTRRRRIIARWIRQKLGLEKCGYTPDFKMLRLMFKWTKNYETGADGLKDRLAPFRGKTAVARTGRDAEKLINHLHIQINNNTGGQENG